MENSLAAIHGYHRQTVKTTFHREGIVWKQQIQLLFHCLWSEVEAAFASLMLLCPLLGCPSSLVLPAIYFRQPLLQVLLRRQDRRLLPLASLISVPLGNQWTGHGHQPRRLRRMAEERHAVAVAAPAARDDDAVRRAPQHPACPVAQHVANIDHDGRKRVALGPERLHRHRQPRRSRLARLIERGLDLQARLARPLEEERQAPEVGVRAAAELLGLGVGVCW